MAKASVRARAPRARERERDDDDDDDDDEREDFVHSLLSGLVGHDDDDLQVRVYKLSGRGRKHDETYLFDVAPDPAAIADVPKELLEVGNGTYRVAVIRNGLWAARTDITVERPPGWVSTKPPPPIAPASSSSDPVAQAIAAQGELLRQLVDRLSRPQVDPTASFERAVALVAKLHPAAAAPAPASSPPATVESGIALFTQGVEFAQKFAGGGDRPSGIFDLLREVISSGALTKFLEQAAAGALAPGAAPGAPVPIAAPATSAQDPARSPPAPPANDPVAQTVRYLLERARNNSSPALYAEWMFDNLGDQLCINLLAQPNLLEQFERVNPEIANFRPWFVALIDEARGMAESPPEMQEGAHGANGGANAGGVGHDTGRAGGDAGNP